MCVTAMSGSPGALQTKLLWYQMGTIRPEAPRSIELTITGLEGTKWLADKIAPFLSKGDTLLLDGELAAGKTHFVKAIVSALGSSDLVTSPTYALVHLYRTASVLIVHADAYRIESIREFEDLGLIDYEEDAITLIEWGHKVQSVYPHALSIDFAFVQEDPEKRYVKMNGEVPKWAALLSSMSFLTE